MNGFNPPLTTTALPGQGAPNSNWMLNSAAMFNNNTSKLLPAEVNHNAAGGASSSLSSAGPSNMNPMPFGWGAPWMNWNPMMMNGFGYPPMGPFFPQLQNAAVLAQMAAASSSSCNALLRNSQQQQQLQQFQQMQQGYPNVDREYFHKPPVLENTLRSGKRFAAKAEHDDELEASQHAPGPMLVCSSSANMRERRKRTLVAKSAKIRKPRRYWAEFDNLKEEMHILMKDIGVADRMPSLYEIKKSGHLSLYRAVYIHGGWSLVAKKLGFIKSDEDVEVVEDPKLACHLEEDIDDNEEEVHDGGRREHVDEEEDVHVHEKEEISCGSSTSSKCSELTKSRPAAGSNNSNNNPSSSSSSLATTTTTATTAIITPSFSKVGSKLGDEEENVNCGGATVTTPATVVKTESAF